MILYNKQLVFKIIWYIDIITIVGLLNYRFIMSTASFGSFASRDSFHDVTLNESSFENVHLDSHSSHQASTAKDRVGHFMGHAYQLMDHLEAQNQTLGSQEKMGQIYQAARNELKQIHAKLDTVAQGNGSEGQQALSKKEIKNLAKEIKHAEKAIAKTIQKAQIETAVEFTGRTDLRDKMAILAKGGIKSHLLKLLSCVISTNREAIHAFKRASQEMSKIKRGLEADPETQVEQDKLEDMKHGREVNRRAGVIGLHGIYRITNSFDAKVIHKQLKSFIAQNLSEKTRETIPKTFEFPTHHGEQKILTSQLIPLNKEFDQAINQRIGARPEDGATVNVFGNIFGDKGISSANRQEPHLVNAWESNLSSHEGQSEKVIYQALRHGIVSDKFEKDMNVRRANSDKAAQELLTAVLMQTLADRKMSLQDAANQPIDLNLNSVSVVTPDDLRAIGTVANEKQMLLDQVEALHRLEGESELTVNGQKIRVNFQVNTFNFGVNAGAVDFKLGVMNQYKHNKKALTSLNKQVEDLIKERPDMEISQRQGLQDLKKDINLLMASPKAYLKGDNQFELAAKILNLTNLMNEIDEYGRYKGSLNCMSGKDRTGILDSIAKTYATMAELNGSYPTHEQLSSNPQIRKQFQEIAVKLLKESGGLEITELNTDARGYKVSKHALVGGISEEHFLDLIGLSKTTSS